MFTFLSDAMFLTMQCLPILNDAMFRRCFDKNWLKHYGTGSVWSGIGWYSMVLGQWKVVLVGTWWYWVIIGWYWFKHYGTGSVLGGTGSVDGGTG